jgi:hypothetical protein
MGTFFQTVVELKFGRDWRSHVERRSFLRAVPEHDRHFDHTKGVWVLRNPHLYTHLRPVKVAIENREFQEEL